MSELNKSIYGKLTNIAARLLTSCTKVPVDLEDFKTKSISTRKVVKLSSGTQENLRKVAVDIINIRDSIANTEYKLDQFCNDIDCLWRSCSGCLTDAKRCVYTAKELYELMAKRGCRIVKDKINAE